MKSLRIIYYFITHPIDLFDLLKSIRSRQDVNPFQKTYEDMSVVDSYRAILKLRMEILDVVFGDYTNGDKFIFPDYWLQLDYVGVNRRLKNMTKEKILSSLPGYDFDRFLEVN